MYSLFYITQEAEQEDPLNKLETQQSNGYSSILEPTFFVSILSLRQLVKFSLLHDGTDVYFLDIV